MIRRTPNHHAQPAPRTTTPGVESADSAGFSADQLAAWQQYNAQLAQNRPVVTVPAERLPEFRSLPLALWYREPEFGVVQYLQRVKPHRGRGTYQKDRNAISLFERFSPRPPAFGEIGERWPGPAIGAITSDELTGFVANALIRCSVGTLRGVWGHLRAMLRHAVRAGVLDDVPAPIWPEADSEHANQIYQRPGATICDTIAEVFDAMPPDLLDPLVVSLECGPRTVDLFGLRWSNFDLTAARPFLRYRANKTRKLQKIPLTPVAAARLRARRTDAPPAAESDPLFPDLTAIDSRQPEKSRRARDRNARAKAALAAIGLNLIDGRPVDRPWQVGRKTCNERWCRASPQAGEFVHGHADTVNSKFYREPSDLIWSAAEQLETPENFWP